MKASEIKVGEAYQAKVAGRTQDVRIERKLLRGGWEAVSLETNKKVRVKTPQQLLGPATPAEASAPTQEPIAAPGGDKQPGSSDGAAEASGQAEPQAPAPKGKRSKGVKAKPTAGDEVPAGEKKLSCLDAAARVLRDKGEPLNCKQMVDAMFAAKLWHSDAPTPAATLSSAILREMNTKKDASRFRKTGRGLFEFCGK